MNEEKLELYWSEIPVGKENAVTYAELIAMWGRSERDVRKILHDLSAFDNGDDFILIRSAKSGGGFYRTDKPDEMKEYRLECLNKGRSTFAPVKKINRVLQNNLTQKSLFNNLRYYREKAGNLQSFVCTMMHSVDPAFDVPMLSKMENGICLPTPIQLNRLAQLYKCDPTELVDYEIFF